MNGTNGTNGGPGPQGPPGPSDVYVAKLQAGNSLSLNVPAGNFLIHASATGGNTNLDDASATTCSLSTGATASAKLATNGEPGSEASYPLLDNAVFGGSGGTITLECFGIRGNVPFGELRIFATKIGAFH